MEVTKNNYVRLKRALVDELTSDVTSIYQLGSDDLSNVKLESDEQHLLLTLTCFGDFSAIEDLRRAMSLLNNVDHADAEDQIDAWLDKINLD